MFFPVILTWMKKPDGRFAYLIDASDVIRFMKIARTTSKREVYFSISAITRDWNNVFDFE